MVIVGIISWWYSTGLMQALRAVGKRLAGLFDFFSIDLLLKTLFSPFRQISAGRVSGPLGAQLQAFGDRLISRVIGAIARSLLIFVGLLSLSVVGFVSLAYILIWILMPILPVIGLTLALAGWLPWQN